MLQLYQLIYRATSGDSLHTSAVALDRHLNVGKDGHIESLAFGPHMEDLTSTVSAAIAAILHGLQVVQQVFPDSSLDAELESRILAWKTLVG